MNDRNFKAFLFGIIEGAHQRHTLIYYSLNDHPYTPKKHSLANFERGLRLQTAKELKQLFIA